ncbi:uncharacterized protein LOC132304892 [Cornus florida]|uniref:uncharacterized protein LOC132304892 n=1 Tax=Cornus florida TaxID=4283 RepID=UPI002898081E|nr:uncharacterized protein LOC132304892 [Cornus florida]
MDYQIWLVIVNGPFVPMKGFGAERVRKTEAEWNTEDYKLISLNAKAKINLNCAISPNEYNRVSTCTTAKEIWDKLQITYEGTSQVKESKIDILMHQYELFRMNENESISTMFVRFTDIINGLKHLGRTMTNSDLTRKILRSLPEKWDAKATAIKEAHNLNTLELDELLGSLLTWEITLKDREGDHHRKKEISLKAFQFEKEVSNNERRNSTREGSKRENPLMSKANVTPPPNFIVENWDTLKLIAMPTRRKRKRKEQCKPLGKNGSESDEEKVILCLKASRDEVNSNSDSSSENEITYDDLVDAYNGLLNGFKELHYELGKMDGFKVSTSSKDKWFLDSGCSRHMTGDRAKFSSLEAYNGGSVTFRDNSKGKAEKVAGDRNKEREVEQVEVEEEEEEEQESMHIPPSNERSIRELLLENLALSKKQIALGKENKEHILDLRLRLEEIANEVDLVKKDLANLRVTGLPHF